MPYICTKNGSDTISKSNTTKGHDSVNVGEVTVVKLYTSFCHAFMKQISLKFLKDFRGIEKTRVDIQEIYKTA